jgi:hypothetical protein
LPSGFKKEKGPKLAAPAQKIIDSWFWKVS